VQSTNSSLQCLRRCLRKPWKTLLCFGQGILLHLITWKWCISRDSVLFFQETSIRQTFSRCQPIFQLTQGIVVCLSASFQPLLQERFLDGIRIESVGVIQCQHSFSIAHADGKWLFESPSMGAQITAIHPRPGHCPRAGNSAKFC